MQDIYYFPSENVIFNSLLEENKRKKLKLLLLILNIPLFEKPPTFYEHVESYYNGF